MKELIVLKNVLLGAGRRPAIRVRSWVLLPGESWAILGPSGSGKTLLGMVLSGDLSPGAGQVDTRLSTVCEPKPGKSKIIRLAFGNEEETLARHSPYHQARWYGSEEGLSPSVADWLFRGQRRDASLVRVLGLGHLLGRRVMQLSNGEFRKLALARALAEKPGLLVLDDLFSGLDKASRESIKRSLDILMKRGLTVVLIAARPQDIPKGLKKVLQLQNGISSEMTLKAGGWEGFAGDLSTRRRSKKGHRVYFSSSKSSTRKPGTVLSQPAVEGRSRINPPSRLPRTLTPLVDMRGITVKYGNTTVLRDVQWTILPGERWLVRGPNGSGKSTLLALMLADHPQAYTNDLYMFGRKRGSGESIWEIKRRIGWLSPELRAHIPGSTKVLDVVLSGYFDTLGLHRACTGGQIARARKLLSSLGLSGPGSMLGLLRGDKQLVLLARALVKRPRLLLLDEPTQGLDTAGRKKVIQAVERACGKSGPALVWVTHHPAEVPGILNRELRLKDRRAETTDFKE